MYAVTVTSSPGSGELGLNSIPRPSERGLTSAIAMETTELPMTTSMVASPSMSAIEGEAHVLCSSSKSSDQAALIPADVPVEPSNAHNERPNGTISSGSPSSSMFIQEAEDTAISSFGVPLLCSISLCQASLGVAPSTS